MAIGVTFLPSDQQAQDGPRRGAMEGDLGEAVKILSLNLRRQPDVRGIAPPSLLQSQGSRALPSGQNPMAAIVEALLKAMGHGQPTPLGGQSFTPKIIPGDTSAPSGVVRPTGPAAERTAFVDRTAPDGGNVGEIGGSPFTGFLGREKGFRSY